jgi:hypothetical protein
LLPPCPIAAAVVDAGSCWSDFRSKAPSERRSIPSNCYEYHQRRYVKQETHFPSDWVVVGDDGVLVTKRKYPGEVTATITVRGSQSYCC